MNKYTVLVSERAEPGDIHVFHVEAKTLDGAADDALRSYWADETEGWSSLELIDYPFDPKNYIVHGVAYGHICFIQPA